MIAGHVTIEDYSIHFQMVDDGLMQFTACDGLTGKQYGMQCTPHQFPVDFWTSAELTQSEDKALRWIP